MQDILDAERVFHEALLPLFDGLYTDDPRVAPAPMTRLPPFRSVESSAMEPAALSPQISELVIPSEALLAWHVSPAGKVVATLFYKQTAEALPCSPCSASSAGTASAGTTTTSVLTPPGAPGSTWALKARRTTLTSASSVSKLKALQLRVANDPEAKQLDSHLEELSMILMPALVQLFAKLPRSVRQLRVLSSQVLGNLPLQLIRINLDSELQPFLFHFQMSFLGSLTLLFHYQLRSTLQSSHQPHAAAAAAVARPAVAIAYLPPIVTNDVLQAQELAYARAEVVNVQAHMNNHFSQAREVAGLAGCRRNLAHILNAQQPTLLSIHGHSLLDPAHPDENKLVTDTAYDRFVVQLEAQFITTCGIPDGVFEWQTPRYVCIGFWCREAFRQCPSEAMQSLSDKIALRLRAQTDLAHTTDSHHRLAMCLLSELSDTTHGVGNLLWKTLANELKNARSQLSSPASAAVKALFVNPPHRLRNGFLQFLRSVLFHKYPLQVIATSAPTADWIPNAVELSDMLKLIFSDEGTNLHASDVLQTLRLECCSNVALWSCDVGSPHYDQGASASQIHGIVQR